MDFVINEWFPEYCRVEESEANKKANIIFLDKFLHSNDRIYIRIPSPFLNKVERYFKTYQNHRDTYPASVLGLFKKRIWLDSTKCVHVEDDCILEDIVKEKLNEGNYASDTYLFEAASKTESKLIITTDDKLCRQMHNIAGYKVVNLSVFLQDY